MLLADSPYFLNIEDLQAEIVRYTYRPGWELIVFDDPWEGPCLYVVADVIDAWEPEKTTELRVRSNIPPMRSGEDFGIWLAWRLMQIESHESREYLRRDGRTLHDPHDPVEPGGRHGP